MTTPISPLPTPPSPADSPVDFNTKAFALLGALPAFVTEANAQAYGVDAAVVAAEAEADAAALKAGEALISANNAAISKTGADSARDDAVIAKNAAEAALDSFAARYLGAKAAAPTTDNDGAALLPGALYWDTVIGAMRVWSGSVWVTLPATTAAAISNTPAGSISATTVQAAINELDSEKVAKTAVIAIANGGTGETTANAAADAIGAFRRGTLLGTVSQSAGVPTGAVIESGSNANGGYTRFACGTLWCWQTSSALPFEANTDGYVYWALPSPCIAVASTVLAILRAASSTNYFTVSKSQMVVIDNFSARLTVQFSTAQNYSFNLMLIGRWF